MTTITVDKLQSAVNAILETVGQDEEFRKYIKRMFGSLRSSFNAEAVSYCFEKYITAELDADTLGGRGLGRLTDHIPRLGAYFRKGIGRLSDRERAELYGLIESVMIRGYLAHVIDPREGGSEARAFSGEKLFEAWIPGIYSTNPSMMDETMRNCIEIFCFSAWGAVEAFLAERGMKGGGLLSKDKTGLIFFYYSIAGYGIRFVELRGGPSKGMPT